MVAAVCADVVRALYSSRSITGELGELLPLLQNTEHEKIQTTRNTRSKL